MPQPSRLSSRLYSGTKSSHFTSDRQNLHDDLRRVGFLRSEARELSKLGHNDPVLARMVEQRKGLLSRFSRDRENRNLSDSQFRTRFHKAVREFYKYHKYLTDKDSRGLDSKGKPGGKPSHWEWFRHLERRFQASVREQLEHGGKVSLKPSDMVRLKGYPDDGKGKPKGQVKAQKARSRARSRAFLNHEVATSGGVSRKVPLERLLAWREDARTMAKAKGGQGRIQREWRASLTERIRTAKAERLAGRDAVA
jgi:hypothetical protein